MKFRAHILSLTFIFVLVACAPQQPPDTSEADAAAIRAQVDKFVAAWNTADNATLVNTISEDAILMQPDGPSHEGRDRILETMASGYDIETMQQTAVVDEVIVMGDHAYARGTWTLDPTSAAGADAPALNGKWATLSKRGPGGSWQIFRWIWNQPSGAVPPGA